METPDPYTLRMHLKTPNTMFPQNVAEAVAIIFAREVLEEDGDLKKRLIGTGPYILTEHERKVKMVLQITKTDYTTFFGRYTEGKWDGTAGGADRVRSRARRANVPIHALQIVKKLLPPQ